MDSTSVAKTVIPLEVSEHQHLAHPYNFAIQLGEQYVTRAARLDCR